MPENEVLTIEPGTEVIFNGYFTLTVLGGFVARGTAEAPIVMTTIDTTEYSNYELLRGGWAGITFSDCTDEVTLNYCDISYGKTKRDCDGGAMRFYNAGQVEIANCKIHNNTMRRRGGAIYAENTEFYIHGCEIYDNRGYGYMGSYCWGAGLQFLKCDIVMHDMLFHHNNSDVAYGGGMNVDSCNLVLNKAVFHDNYATNAAGLGIQRCKGYEVKVSNMLAYHNAVIHYGGGIAMATSDPEINNITLTDNYCGGGGGAGMQMAFDSAPIISNSIIYGNHAIASLILDTIEYYIGSQIWMWGDDNLPHFYNSTVQYGLDSIQGCIHVEPDQYVDMIMDDPLFVDEDANNYQLSQDSPCINAGRADTTGMFIPSTDLGGGPRVFNNVIDMGCYEWNNIGLNELPADANTLTVYPNPLDGNAYCTVNLKKTGSVVIRLVSLDGKEVYREDCGVLNAGEQRIQLDKMVKNLEKSDNMYILIVDNQCVKVVY